MLGLIAWSFGFNNTVFAQELTTATETPAFDWTQTETDPMPMEYTATPSEIPTDTPTGIEFPVVDTPSSTEPIFSELFTPTETLGITDSVTIPTETLAVTDDVPPTSPVFVPNEVLLELDQLTTSDSVQPCLQQVGATIKSQLAGANVLLLDVTMGTVQETVNQLQTCQGVMYAGPNYYLSSTGITPNDALFSLQPGLLDINASKGWEMTTGSPGVTIAIIDTGVDLDHPDLADKILTGYNALSPGTSPQDDNGHGSHVAGIAAALTNNGIGIAGVDWGAMILPVKVLNVAGVGTDAGIADGIYWAVDHGAQVINLSLGGPNPSPILEGAINYAYAHGVLVVAASGNTSSNAVDYPAAYAHVIGVGAVDALNNLASYSNIGTGLDVVAPGGVASLQILSTDNLGSYSPLYGTSMSAPFVSGLAALLRGIPGNFSVDTITDQIESTALDLGTPGWDPYTGYGLINADQALQLLLPTATLTFTPTLTSTSTNTPIPKPAQKNTLESGPGIANPTGTSSATITLTPTVTLTPTLQTTQTELADSTVGTSTNTSVVVTVTPVVDPSNPNNPIWFVAAGVGIIGIGFLYQTLRRRRNP